MHGYQHKKMGLAAGVGVFAYAVTSKSLPMESAIAMLLCPIGAMLPDIDHDRTKIGRARKSMTDLVSTLITLGVIVAVAGVSYFSYISGGIWKAVLSLLFFMIPSMLIFIVQKNKHIKRVLGFITMHRGIMHTLVPIVILIATTVWIPNLIYEWSVYSLSLGYFVHLWGDMDTEEGVPLFWPVFKFNFKYAPLNTKRHGPMIEMMCNAWCIIFVVVGLYLGMRGGL